MIEDYNGTAVVDAAGEKIGTVERSYVDDGGAVQMVRVKLGKLFAKHRLVLVDGLRPQDDTLRIPYPKQLVEEAPDVDAADDLAGEALERVGVHCATLREVPRVRDTAEAESAPRAGAENIPTVGDGESAAVGGIRDRGDVIEVPILEEEIVKRAVVKEVLRVRKETRTRQQPVATTLRREELVVDERGNADLRTDDEAAAGGRQEPPPTLAEQRRFTEERAVRTGATEHTERVQDAVQ